MKRTLSLALITAIGAACLPALAQDMFVDTPDNHWAYEALLTLKKDGLLTGFPDGLLRGNRPASRYEMAVATHAAYKKLAEMSSGIQAQVAELNKGLDGQLDKADLAALKASIESLRKELEGVKGWTADFDAVKKLAAEFEEELKAFGVDVEAMKKDISDLKDRVAKLETRKPAIDIHGTADFVLLGGYAGKNKPGVVDDEFGITVDGRPTGIGRSDYDADAAGIFRDLTILHELALEVSHDSEKGPDWKATLVVGNALDSAYGLGNQSETMDGKPFGEGDTYIYFQEFEVRYSTTLAGQKFNIRAGRLGYQIHPFILKRPEGSPHFENERWNNGNWVLDGAIVSVPIGSATLEIVGGRNGSQNAAGRFATELQPMRVGKLGVPIYLNGSSRPRGDKTNTDMSLRIDQTFGVHAQAPLGKAGQIDFSYLWLVSNESQPVNNSEADRLAVYGATAKFKVHKFDVEGGYVQSDIKNGWHEMINTDNYAWWAAIGYKNNVWGLSAAYKVVQPLFSAPGEWGRIGIWWNPTDIQGLEFKGFANLNQRLTLRASAELYTGTDNGALDGTTPEKLGFGTDDKVNRFLIGLDYCMTSRWKVSVDYETVLWDLKGRTNPLFVGGKPTETWYNLAFDYEMSEASRLSLLWQVSDYNAKGVPGFGPFASGIGNLDRAKGGLITTQLSVKF